MITRGANIDAQGRIPVVTPLHCAAEFGHPEVTMALIENGADIYAKDLVSGA